MGSRLESCIKKMGKSLDKRDINAIRARVIGGMSEQDAVEAHIGALLDAPIGSPGMWPPAMQVARDYAESAGLVYTPPLEYAPPVDEDRARRIAHEFDLMEHNPKDPLVKAAYKALIKETLAQFEFILKTGLKIEFIRGDDPYKEPSDVIRDVRLNNHMWVFPTVTGFGSGQKFKGNPLESTKTKYVIDGHALVANDVFRIVHDYFGHVAPGAAFRARGEETAYQAHAAMFSPLARRALAVETRGQNSWLNYGPHGETNRTAKTEDTVFADQKIGLLPIWVSEEGRQSAYERQARFQRVRQANSTGFEGAIDAAGRVELVHYSNHDLQRISPRHWGKGLSRFVRSETNRRLAGAPGRAYFGIESAKERPYRKESGLGNRRLVTRVPGELIYRLDQDIDNLWDSSDIVASETAIRDAGYVGYMRVHPELGKVVALFDEVQVESAKVVYNQNHGLKLIYSAVERAVGALEISEWNKGQPAPWDKVWAKIRKSPGVKAAELHWLGIEDFFKNQKNVTRLDLMVFLENYGINLEETIADQPEEDSEEDISWDEDMDDDSSNWEGYADDIYSEWEDDRNTYDLINLKQWWEKNEAQVIEKIVTELDVNEDEAETLFTTMDEDELFDLTKDLMELDAKRAAYEWARDSYFDSPNYTWTSQTFSDGSELVIHGSDNNGWHVWHRRGSSHISDIGGGYFTSVSEAQIQARDYAMEQGLLGFNDDEEMIAKWESYVTPGDYRDYRVVKLKMPRGLSEDFYETAHFPDANILAFGRITTRDLTPFVRKSEPVIDPGVNGGMYRIIDSGTGFNIETRGGYYSEEEAEKGIVDKEYTEFVSGEQVKTYFIDEFQSDLHQHGREFGYKSREGEGTIRDDYRNVSSELQGEITNLYDDIFPDRTETETIVPSIGRPLGVNEFGNQLNLVLGGSGNAIEHEEIQSFIREELEKRPEISESIRGKIKERERLWRILKAEQEGAPDAPFKDGAWIELGIKRFIIDAIESGAEAIAWPNSTVLRKRWGDKYHKLYWHTYDEKMTSVFKRLMKATPTAITLNGEFPIDTGVYVEQAKEFSNQVKRDLETGSFTEDNPIVNLETRYEAYVTSDGKYAVKDRYSSNPDLYDTADELVRKSKFISVDLPSGFYAIPITEELKAEVLGKGFPLFQPSRAQIEIDPTTNDRLIRLQQSSDRTSFLHEAAHLYLEIEKELSKAHGMRPHVEELFKWLGVSSWDEIGVEEHETFAETFETYLQKGEAPSLGLRKAFAAFRQWMVQVYKTFDPRSRARLTPEISDYFDRMLATDTEIARAKGDPAYQELFRSKEQAGMTDAEWEKYQKRLAKARTKSTAAIDEKLIGEVRKRLSADWKAEKEPLIEEQKEELRKQRQYQILSDLPGSPMDYDAVVSIMGALPGNLIGRAKKGGIDPAEYAELYGYPNAKAMLTDLAATPSLNKLASENAEKIMIERHGDILNDGSIEQEVRQAMHNDEQAKLMLMELKALNKKTKIDLDYLKLEAKRLIGTMKYKEIKPNRYYTAEVRAAKKAATSKDRNEQAAAKAQQLANHYLYREAVETKSRMERQRKKVRGVQTRTYSTRQVDPETVRVMKLLANTYEMRKGKDRSDNLMQLVTWFETQINAPNEFGQIDVVDPLIAKLIAEKQAGASFSDELPEFDDLTADQLNGLSDQLDHMRFIGGKRSDDAKADMIADRESIAQVVVNNAKKTFPPQHQKGRFTRALNLAKQFIASHHRLASLFDQLSGYEASALDAEMNRVSDASNRQIELQLSVAKLLEDAFKGSRAQLSGRQKVSITKMDGETWELTTQARLVLALNWGTENNREVLLQGLNNNFPDTYTDSDVLAMLSTMSNEELGTVNAIWAATETLWPLIQGVSIRTTGLSPTKLDPAPFEVNGTKMTGGHYKLVYERAPADSSRMELSVEGESMNRLLDMKPAGSTIERVGSGGRQVSLELQHLFNTVTENVHYIAYAELAQRLKALFTGNKNPVTEAIIRHQGQPWFDNLLNTFEGIVDPNVEAATPWWAAARAIRTNLTFAYLALSVRNVIQQPTAITNAFAHMGELTTMRGFFQFYGAGPFSQAADVRNRSVFMRHRLQLMNRESREQLTKINSASPGIGTAKTMAFAPQMIADALVAYPVWIAAEIQYRKDNPNATEEDIVRHADTAVKKTIGSGQAMDVGSIFNANEAMKQITFMGTFFNLTFNLHVEYFNLWKKGDIGELEYARRLAWMAVAPGILAALLVDDWDEDEDFGSLLWKVLGYNMAAVFGVREMFNALDGFQPSMPAMQVFKGVAGMVSLIEGLMSGEKDFTPETAARAIRNLQPIIPIPTQIPRIIEGVNDENQDWWGTLVEGKERNKQ